MGGRSTGSTTITQTPPPGPVTQRNLDGQQRDEGQPSSAFSGETKPLGNGTVSTFAQLDAAGTVTAIGATFGAAALTGLPAAMSETVVALPAAAVSAGPYTFFAANWNRWAIRRRASTPSRTSTSISI